MLAIVIPTILATLGVAYCSAAAITRLAMVLMNCLKDREPRWLNQPPAMNRDFLWHVS